MRNMLRAGLVGMLGGLVGNGVLGVLFSSEAVRRVLYDPALQSALFLEVTPQRDIALSVMGLVVLSAIHGCLYSRFASSVPGHIWWQRGIYWGGVIWAMYWLPQEWFIYHTLLGEPLLLCLFELSLLAVGSVVEGLVIAWCLHS